MSLTKRCIAEFLGTFWLVFGGCGSAVLAATVTADNARLGPNTAYPLGVGLVGVALAFGLALLTMLYAVGQISGGHFNPAVSIGLWTARRFPASELFVYIGSQVFGAIAAAGILALIAGGKPGFNLVQSGFAANGYGEHSPGKYSLLACLIAELLLTFFFVLIILGATERTAPQGLAPIAIGFALTLIHLISIPITNTSVNPARSLGPAIFVGGWALQQLWLFWLAPLLGGGLAGVFYALVLEARTPSERPLSEVT